MINRALSIAGLAALCALVAAPELAVANDCGSFFECAEPCAAGDQACVNACVEPLSENGFAALQLFAACINESDCETNECVFESCPYEAMLCLGGDCPAGLDLVGQCDGDVVSWCELDSYVQIDCAAAGSTCGFDEQNEYYACLAAEPEGGEGGPEPCPPGLTFEGECNGDVVTWCENDQYNEIDCGAQGLICAFNDTAEFYDCAEPPADEGGETPADEGGETPADEGGETPADEGGETPADEGGEIPEEEGGGEEGEPGCPPELPEEGLCEDDVLYYCEEGLLVEVDCTDFDLTCAYDDENGYFDCLNLAAEGGETPEEDGGETPGEDGGETPGEDGGEAPGEGGGETPGEGGGEVPGEGGGEAPGEGGGEAPGEGGIDVGEGSAGEEGNPAGEGGSESDDESGGGGCTSTASQRAPFGGALSLLAVAWMIGRRRRS